MHEGTHPRNDVTTHPEAHPEDRSGLRDRFGRAVRGLPEPGTRPRPAGFHGITNEQYRERLLLVRRLVALRFSVEQMVDFLPTWGLKLSQSQVYEYLARLRLPRGYERSERHQDPH